MELLVEEIFGQPATNRNWTGAIVIQGPYHGIHTERAVREFLERNATDTLVILSSFMPVDPRTCLSVFEVDQLFNSSSRYFGQFICISCRYPDREEFPDFWRTNVSNQNLQRLSSFIGMNYARQMGIEVSVKIRSDAFLALESCCSRLREMVDKYPLTPDPISEKQRADSGILPQRARILVSDLCVLIDDRNPGWGYMGHYFIADVWSFGYIEDMLRYFDIRDGTSWDRGKGMPHDCFAETNLAHCWKKEMRLRGDMKLLEMMTRYFIVSDRDDTLFFWPRWWDYEGAKRVGLILFLKSLPRCFPERFTHQQWLSALESASPSPNLLEF